MALPRPRPPLLLSLLALPWLGAPSAGAPVAYENFGSYTTGQAVSNNKAPTATSGFAVWDGHRFTPTITAGNVWYADASGATLEAGGKKLLTSLGGTVVWGSLDTAPAGEFGPWLRDDGTIGKSGTTLYLSLTFELTTAVAASSQTLYRLVHGEISGQNPVNPHVLHLGQEWGSGQFSVSGPGAQNRVNLAAIDTLPHAVVVKFVFGEEADQATVWFDPLLGVEESAQTIDATLTGDFHFDKLWIKGQTSQSYLDEIRWGATFADVTPLRTAPTTFALTVLTEGPGTVTLDPPGGEYEIGTSVALTAQPAAHALFTEWAGALSGANPGQTLIMDQARTVTARFHAITVQDPLTVVVDPWRIGQTIEGFGANTTLGATAQGNEAFRTFVARDLGFSLFRMALPPSVLPAAVENPDDLSHLAFSVQPGDQTDQQLRFLDALRSVEPGVRVIGTVWSPPGWMKDSGQSSGTRAGFLFDANRTYDRDNRLRDDRYKHMARYLVEWARFMEARGTPLYGIGPQNELLFTEPYDSCLYTAEEFARLVRMTGERFAALGVTRPLLYGPEDMTAFPERQAPYFSALTAPGTGEFFDRFASHGYIDGTQADLDPAAPAHFWNSVQSYRRPFWVTEGGTGGHTWPEPLHSLGAMLHHLLVNGQVSAFTPWQLSGSTPDSHNLMAGTNPTLKTRVAQHYWNPLRPGSVRVGTEPSENRGGKFLVSAFRDAARDHLAVILLNRQQDDQPVRLELAADVGFSEMAVRRTTGTGDAYAALPPVALAGGAIELTVPAESIVTLLGTGEVLEGVPAAAATALGQWGAAVVLDQRWLWEPFLGYAYYRHAPFMYSPIHGWLWCGGSFSGPGVYVYDWRLGWLYLQSSTGAWFHHFATGAWYRHLDGAAPERILEKADGTLLLEESLFP